MKTFNSYYLVALLCFCFVWVNACSSETEGESVKPISQAQGFAFFLDLDIRNVDYPFMQSEVPGTNKFTVKSYHNHKLVNSRTGTAVYLNQRSNLFYEYMLFETVENSFHRGDTISFQVDINTFARAHLTIIAYKYLDGQGADVTSSDFGYSGSKTNPVFQGASKIKTIESVHVFEGYAEEIDGNLDREFSIKIAAP